MNLRDRAIYLLCVTAFLAYFLFSASLGCQSR